VTTGLTQRDSSSLVAVAGSVLAQRRAELGPPRLALGAPTRSAGLGPARETKVPWLRDRSTLV